jgi:acyl-CoA dehydrogenase
VLNGEKWFASASDIAGVILLLAKAQPGDRLTIFLVDPKSRGLELKHLPRTMGNGVYEHPQMVLRNVVVPRDAVLGEVGAGMELTREWFVEERFLIAARCVGGSERALLLATEWAKERIAFGRRLIEHQLVQATLADCAVEVASNRVLLYHVALEAEAGLDLKLCHAKAAMVKLSASDAACRVVDKCQQLFGGRGYLRDYPVERLYRALRVERIWEGTSDIQRLILGNEIDKRGVEGLLAVGA